MKYQVLIKATYDADTTTNKIISIQDTMDTIKEVDILSEGHSPIQENGDQEIKLFDSKTMEALSTRPSSTPRMPTLTSRATLIRTPKATTRVIEEDNEKEIQETTNNINEVIEDPPAVLITELAEEFPTTSPPLDQLDDSESDDSLYEREFQSQVIALESTVPEPLSDSKLDEYWDTDLEEEDNEEEDDPVVCQYKKICEDLGIVPISYFIRHINDTDIQMKYHGLDPSATRAISLILKDDVHIEKINLEGNWIKAEGAISVARMLEENDYVTDLGLGDNKLGNDGAQSICKMLEINGGLRSLDISANEIDDNCADCIAATIENCKHLKHLNLSHNKFGESGGEKLGPAIGANDRLDSLDLSWNHVRKIGACAIAKGLKENVGLKVCKLAWNGFGPEGGTAIADALATNQSLIKLDISGNRLDLTSAEKIAKAFKTNDTLKVLRMGNNLITTTGAINLVTAINANVNCELELLDLTDIPVEYEFLRIVEDIRSKRKEFQVIHGPIIRSGNTGNDLSKPAIDPYKLKEPVLVLDGHIVVNDLRLVEILSRYDPTDSCCVSPEDFITALDELAVPYDKLKLQEALERMSKDQSGRIYLGDALQKKDNEKTDISSPKEKS